MEAWRASLDVEKRTQLDTLFSNLTLIFSRIDGLISSEEDLIDYQTRCMQLAEWLDAFDKQLVQQLFHTQVAYMQFVYRYRVPIKSDFGVPLMIIGVDDEYVSIRDNQACMGGTFAISNVVRPHLLSEFQKIRHAIHRWERSLPQDLIQLLVHYALGPQILQIFHSRDPTIGSRLMYQPFSW